MDDRSSFTINEICARNHISRIDLAAALSTQWSWQGDESAAEEPEQPAAVATAVSHQRSSTATPCRWHIAANSSNAGNIAVSSGNTSRP